MSVDSLANCADARLRARGFSRDRLTWNRSTGSTVDVVDIQVNKTGTRVTLNCGVLDTDTYAVCWGTPAPAFVEEPFCTVRARLGRLMGRGDQWWSPHDDDAIDELLERIEDTVLPFIARMNDRREMANYLAEQIKHKRYPDPLAVAYLAIVEAQLGDVNRACSVLAEHRPNVLGDWQIRLKEVSSRLGCPD